MPSIAYSGNYDGGIFVYGDRIYYGTPSTAKNSEGVDRVRVQLARELVLGCVRLDGVKLVVAVSRVGNQYRYVEEGGTVYLLYVATEEKLYEESTGVTNLHSYNTATGTDTLATASGLPLKGVNAVSVRSVSPNENR